MTTEQVPGCEEACEVLRSIFEAGGMQIEPRCLGEQDSYLHIDLTGPDAAETFASHGRMLDALQYLTNLILGRRGVHVRVVLDSEGFRKRREEVLTAMALKYADEVKARQEECEFDPMPPHERRIIHRVLLDDEGVRTYSEGEEPDRRVIIAPR
jgi:spoIIIJ-associated protein